MLINLPNCKEAIASRRLPQPQIISALSLPLVNTLNRRLGPSLLSLQLLINVPKEISVETRLLSPATVSLVSALQEFSVLNSKCAHLGGCHAYLGVRYLAESCLVHRHCAGVFSCCCV